MKMYEAALFKLALKGTITLEQAKILKALHNKECAITALQKETGIGMYTLFEELETLEKKGIVAQRAGLYLIENFEEKISELIGERELQAIRATAQ
ncbi:MAG: hypothetical protein NUV67_05235 [archaeon]|nr:hypothetical protein [archaeon]